MFRMLKALFVAIKAHKGQRDKGGKPYIFHPIKVALNVSGYSQRIVALLHDVIEDSNYKLGDLKFLKEDEKEALILLTRVDKQDYFDYIKSIRTNSIARSVKLADLDQNMNLKRLKIVSCEDLKRREKYEKARKILLSE
ncbi:HD domain-containing protein [Peptoniphilus catoniae]|uniref:HD domain-containing protein n=1 Tax=Peptoniphilus catoniae TaxID=1660341 RepID=UPI0010FE6E88|nr:HD domain-containing protein [Peptoniphilus catoniae]